MTFWVFLVGFACGNAFTFAVFDEWMLVAMWGTVGIVYVIVALAIKTARALRT